MTVKELIEKLQTLDPSLMIVLGRDGEGNSYAPLRRLETDSKYEADTAWSGELICRDDMGDLGMTDAEWDALPHAVALFP